MHNSNLTFLSTPFGALACSLTPAASVYPQLTAQTQVDGFKRYPWKLYDLETNRASDLLRTVLKFANIRFKDKRLKPEQWIKRSKKISFDRSPILRLTDKFYLFDADVILRFVGRMSNLCGNDDYQRAIVDMILTLDHAFQDRINSSNEQSEQNQSLLEDYMTQLETFLKIYRSEGPFCFGSQVSLADLVIYHRIHDMEKINSDYPHLNTIRTHLNQHPVFKNEIQQPNESKPLGTETLPSEKPMKSKEKSVEETSPELSSNVTKDEPRTTTDLSNP